MEKHYLIEKQDRFVVNNISKQIQDDQYKIIELLVTTCAFPNMKCVEIGSWTGNSAVLIGTVVKRVLGKLYSIDWYNGSTDGAEHLREIAHNVDVRNIFIDNMQYFNLNDTVEQLPISSKEANKKFDKNSLDFIFIDGDHTYKFVKKDIELWLPKLKKNGIIAGHDYYAEVKEAVDELLPNALNCKEIWWIKKA
jgi:predicted O-methyltransferase YrrM